MACCYPPTAHRARRQQLAQSIVSWCGSPPPDASDGSAGSRAALSTVADDGRLAPSSDARADQLCSDGGTTVQLRVFGKSVNAGDGGAGSRASGGGGGAEHAAAYSAYSQLRLLHEASRLVGATPLAWCAARASARAASCPA